MNVNDAAEQVLQDILKKEQPFIEQYYRSAIEAAERRLEVTLKAHEAGIQMGAILSGWATAPVAFFKGLIGVPIEIEQV